MLCDDAFVSSALDVPIAALNSRNKSSTAVHYVVDEEKEIWSKVIDLESCDRADLSSLLACVGFLRKLSTVLPKADDATVASISSPLSIRIESTSLIMSYKQSSVGSAFDLSSRIPDLPESIIAALIGRTVMCVADLHACGVLHRELCAKHILLTEGMPNNLNVKLCGLGSAAEYSLNPAFVSRNDLPPVHWSWRGWNVPHWAESTPTHPMAWYAPEVLAQDFTGYSWPADIYSIGMLMLELYTGAPPYGNISSTEILLRKLCDSGPPKLERPGTDGFPPSQPMLDVYYACVQHEPSKRPTAHNLLEMPWIKWGRGLELTHVEIQQKTNEQATV